jgi:hypothetical protein
MAKSLSAGITLDCLPLPCLAILSVSHAGGGRGANVVSVRTDSVQRTAHAEEFFAATGANVVHGGSRACYVPSTDNIHMPCIDFFPNARVSNCARAICAWPSAPPSWSGATPMPTSSSAPGENSNSCAPGSAVSSATFAARSRVIPGSRIALARCSISHCGSVIKSSVSASPAVFQRGTQLQDDPVAHLPVQARRSS